METGLKKKTAANHRLDSLDTSTTRLEVRCLIPFS